MKSFLTIVSCLISMISFAQKSDTLITYSLRDIPTKQINKATSIHKVFKMDSTSWIRITTDKNLVITKRETFGDEKLKVLNGSYSEYAEGKPNLKGRYINGNKDGSWITYYINGSAKEAAIYVNNKLNGPYVNYREDGEIKEQGNYLNDTRIGEWKLLTADGKTEMKDYGYVEPKPNPGNMTMPIKLISPATFPGGMPGFHKYISKTLKYPAQAKREGISGSVLSSFVVDSLGNVKDIKILSSPHESLSEETIRILTNSPKWTPSSDVGEKANVRLSVKINFIP